VLHMKCRLYMVLLFPLGSRSTKCIGRVARCRIFVTLRTVWSYFAISCFMVSVGIEGGDFD
jgi:hypothetical protein